MDPYIISGDNAKFGAWPWYVQIMVGDETTCGGSIITDKWILTAAHCLKLATTTITYSLLVIIFRIRSKKCSLKNNFKLKKKKTNSKLKNCECNV